ncbi:hypothetical protein pEaSNUABM37_00132 [Erwinia phage pEa_SNUABM_37]|nr:hypothetical protein pEaSNUABM37_00132 [Erwinia phage pEa_SNUABM_37]QXO10602.1 hypothetical protein pEaSNUABM48_00132 [Erwinia phage pEa_SNUABM_48]
MLEMLVAGGGKPFYPNSGPGPKSLAGGNEQAGYFGTLTQSQLFTSTELFNLLGMPALDPNNDVSMLWCKFYYKGEIVYIPTRPITGPNQQYSWQDLYQLGIVYGTDDDGTFPAPPATPINQRFTISKTLEGKTAGFWPRLSAAYDSDPVSDGTVAGASGKGEFAELLSNVYQVGFRFGTGKWDELPTTSLETGSNAIMKTSSGAAGTGMVNGVPGTSKGLMSFGTTGKTVRSSGFRWWPVLRYLNPADHLLDLTGFTADNPPPKVLDLYVEKGETAGGLITVRSVRGSMTDGSLLSKGYAVLLSRPADIKVGLLSAVPRAITVSTAGSPTVPNALKVSLLGKPPVATARTVPLIGAFGVTATYTPAPLTGIKLVDQ